jgi:type III secretion system low calcium response chaperone LcrH/SycD
MFSLRSDTKVQTMKRGNLRKKEVTQFPSLSLLVEEECAIQYRHAHSLYTNGEYEEALPLFEELVQAVPTEKSYWFCFAAALQMTARYEEALKAYATAALFDYDNITIHLQAAECYLRLDDAIEAEKAVVIAEDIARENNIYDSDVEENIALLHKKIKYKK